MKIDWFTVVAQIINFLILVWLLKKILYRPVLNAMEKRQKKIKDEMKQVAELEKSAEAERAYYLALQEEARLQKSEQLRKATLEADELRKRLFIEIKEEAEARSERWKKELANEKIQFLKEASIQVGEQFIHLSRRALKDLANEDVEKMIVNHFCALIADKSVEDDFFNKLRGSDNLQLFSAFPLSDTLKESIANALAQRLAVRPNIKFCQESTLIAGILLKFSDHYRLEWSINLYLDNFQNELEESLFNNNVD